MSAPGYHVRPVDQGQMVTVSWCDAGANGCIRRVYDASDRSTRYTLHRWLVHGGEFAPWNGAVPVRRRGKRIDESEAMRLAGGAQ